MDSTKFKNYNNYKIIIISTLFDADTFVLQIEQAVVAALVGGEKSKFDNQRHGYEYI